MNQNSSRRGQAPGHVFCGAATVLISVPSLNGYLGLAYLR